MSKIALFATFLVAAAPVHAMAEKDKDRLSPDRRVCKRSVDTGSLIKGKKVCRTAREWEALAQAYRRQTEEMQSSASPGQNN